VRAITDDSPGVVAAVGHVQLQSRVGGNQLVQVFALAPELTLEKMTFVIELNNKSTKKIIAAF